MATQYYQNQEQDDAPRKDASKRSDRRRRTTYLGDWGRVPFHKPKPKAVSLTVTVQTIFN